ncbi:endo alpha-1,4 polygalactosaminidase [Klenkia sp. PcliD-1-E]|uniref:endo alpha-1,4 polygalactosaminidase n=1 Tax=Klenkia sp. PcliD-1-E TaxID=2954492 RepID=UPI0020970A2D|nr:endo alpha-1,4 polygalactosaminidase [Klenkia sp. PcliD-1-E]MCO7220653.1 endo alpha-1,4 polygalactosaminidase [Klenkia sp. PcliD-1-E]
MRGWLLVVLLVLTACSAPTDGGVDGPPWGLRVDYQLGGAYEPADGVTGVVRDRTDPPAPGLWSACYVNAFQTQPGSDEVPQDLQLRTPDGQRVEDPDWPGEFLLDISTPQLRARVAELVGSWVDGCAADGFDAVEPDNLDSWTRSDGLLTRADAEAMTRLLVDRAHAAGLDIAQKNAAELDGAALGLDYAVTEQCQVHDECDVYTDAYGDRVIEVEYTDDAFAEACAARGDRVAVQRRDLDVSVPGSEGYTSRFCS